MELKERKWSNVTVAPFLDTQSRAQHRGQIVTHLLIHRDQVAIDPLEGSDLTVTLNQNCTSAAKTAPLKWISDVSLHMTSANNCDIK